MYRREGRLHRGTRPEPTEAAGSMTTRQTRGRSTLRRGWRATLEIAGQRFWCCECLRLHTSTGAAVACGMAARSQMAREHNPSPAISCLPRTGGGNLEHRQRMAAVPSVGASRCLAVRRLPGPTVTLAYDGRLFPLASGAGALSGRQVRRHVVMLEWAPAAGQGRRGAGGAGGRMMPVMSGGPPYRAQSSLAARLRPPIIMPIVVPMKNVTTSHHHATIRLYSPPPCRPDTRPAPSHCGGRDR